MTLMLANRTTVHRTAVEGGVFRISTMINVIVVAIMAAGARPNGVSGLF